MSSHQHERDTFLLTLTRELPDRSAQDALSVAKRLMRYAQTLHRLAVAQCNGEWPADTGTLTRPTTCQRCASNWDSSAMRYGADCIDCIGVQPCKIKAHHRELLCPDCRTEDLTTALLVGTPFKAIFNGDPRGSVLALAKVTDSREDIESGQARLVYVPVRER